VTKLAVMDQRFARGDEEDGTGIICLICTTRFWLWLRPCLGRLGWLPRKTRLFACDINPRLVDFYQKNISHAETLQCSYYPPLPYRDGQFDFIYAFSLYTHISRPAMLQSTGEIARPLRSGGFALITVHGSYYSTKLAEIFRSGSMLLAEQGYYVHLHGSARGPPEIVSIRLPRTCTFDGAAGALPLKPRFAIKNAHVLEQFCCL
jgi:SAM-dependent methyltransferase